MMLPKVDPDSGMLKELYHRRMTDSVTVTYNYFSHRNDIILLTKSI